jgi:predicted outer membrane repeat protein
LEDRLVPAFLSVTSLADSLTPGTLRSEVAAAAPGDTVGFAVAGTIHLKLGEIAIPTSMTIIGESSTGAVMPVTVNGFDRDRIFEVLPGNTVLIKELTLTDGYARMPGSSKPGLGGAILNQGFLTLDTDVFNYNRASNSGGAVETTVPGPSASASLTVLHSRFRGNRALTGYGGAISNNDPMTDHVGGMSLIISVESTLFVGNTAGTDGGAIDFSLPYTVSAPSASGSLTVTNSTIGANEGADGGGIYFGANHPVSGGTWTTVVETSLFDSNVADGSLTSASFPGLGGGIVISLILPQNAIASALIQNSTITGNAANYGGGIAVIAFTQGQSGILVQIDQCSIAYNEGVQGGGVYIQLDGESINTGCFGGIWQTCVYVTNSTIDDNVASSTAVGGTVYEGDGGGLYAFVKGDLFTLLDCVNDTVAYNTAVTSTSGPSTANGGGLYLTGPTSPALTSLNSLTVAYNYADTNGGGLWAPPGPVGAPPLNVWVRNCAFDLNTVGPGGMGPDVYGSVLSHGYNILSTVNPSFTDPTDIIGAGDLLLDTQLTPYGATSVLLPLPGSPVIGSGGYASMPQFDDPATDQGGFVRASPTNRGSVGP